MYAELALPRLCPYVEAFWSLDAERGGARRILPDGCIDFIFDLDSGYGSVVGTMKSSQLVDLPAGARLFGVRFAPGAAMTFIDAAAHELTDGEAELSQLTRAPNFGIAERVAQAGSALERAGIVAAFLQDRRSRLQPAEPRVVRAVGELRAVSGRVAIARVAQRVGISERHLERLFHERVGSGPKRFARVLRMQTALVQLESAPSYRAAHALPAGFSDEPHLVREFRALTGLTPLQLLQERRVGNVQPVAARLG